MPVIKLYNTAPPISMEAYVPGGQLNNSDDASIALAQPTGIGLIYQAQRQAQLGTTISLSETDALKLSLTTTGTLHEGQYTYVQFLSTSTGANIRGGVVFWNSIPNVIVTPDVTLATQGQIAGIGLMVNTKGNYGWIQTAGRASIKFKSSITKATPAAGDLVIVDQGGGTPTDTADVLADATNMTSLTTKSILGVAAAAPVGGAISLVDLWG